MQRGFAVHSLYTNLSLLYRPTVIAAASIVCAAVQLQASLPTSAPPPPDPAAVELLAKQTGEILEPEPYWLEVLDATPQEVQGERINFAGGASTAGFSFFFWLTQMVGLAAAVEDMLAAYDGASDPFVKAEAARVSDTSLAFT